MRRIKRVYPKKTPFNNLDSSHYMTPYELTNLQRKYFGPEPIEYHWDRVAFKGDTYRPESILYFDKDTIKRHIVSTEKPI